MAEPPRSRREGLSRPRTRLKTDGPDDVLDRDDERPTTLADQAVLAEESADAHPANASPGPEEPSEAGPPAPRPEPVQRSRSRPPLDDDEDFQGFDAEINNRYEEIKRGSTHISELQQMTMPQLLKIARDEGLTDYTGLKKQDLIFRVLKERVKQNGLMFGEGTLEVLPDGFGFLRSPDYNYLPCPDDIYISPSQIRRFGLRTGAVVAGQIRPPKENERYFALLRVEAINYDNPDVLPQKVVFDDLTPLHPNKRLSLEAEPNEINMRVIGGADQKGVARPEVDPPGAASAITLFPWQGTCACGTALLSRPDGSGDPSYVSFFG